MKTYTYQFLLETDDRLPAPFSEMRFSGQVPRPFSIRSSHIQILRKIFAIIAVNIVVLKSSAEIALKPALMSQKYVRALPGETIHKHALICEEISGTLGKYDTCDD